MDTPRPDTTAVLRDHSRNLALEAAAICLEAADEGDLQALGELQNVKVLVAQLEVLLVARIRTTHSWGEIAGQLNVERQSAHRRLSKAADQVLDDARDASEQPDYTTSRRRGQVRNTRRIHAALPRLRRLNRPVVIRCTTCGHTSQTRLPDDGCVYCGN